MLGKYAMIKVDFGSGIAVGPGGDVFVSETIGRRCQRFDAAGAFLLLWGTAGTAPGEFDAPLGLAVDGAGRVIVADGGNGRLSVFGPGTALSPRSWGRLKAAFRGR